VRVYTGIAIPILGEDAMSEELKQEWLDRIDAAEVRLRRHAEGLKPGGLTDADPETGEQWEAGEVWAHIAEFVPYWTRALRGLFDAYQGEPVPFGRTRTDPERIGAIERDREVSPGELFDRAAASIEEFRTCVRTWGDREFAARAMHSRLGEMDLRAVVERFVVGHLEEHAEHLDGLVAQTRG
jgi:hypothetical protein